MVNKVHVFQHMRKTIQRSLRKNFKREAVESLQSYDNPILTYRRDNLASEPIEEGLKQQKRNLYDVFLDIAFRPLST